MSLQTVNALWAALPRPKFDEDNQLHLPGYETHQTKAILARMLSDDLDAWSVAAARVGYCSNPVHLVGSSTTIDTSTGEVLAAYSSADEPLGSTVVRCGNRRESACPSCSRLYAADMFQLIRAGVRGGKTVPEQVADNPLVFATLTAPSMGAVHGTRDSNRRCRPHASGQPRCPHGRSTSCLTVHTDGDEALGQPLCRDCYDYGSHVVWQWWAPELWRRFTITLRRTLARHLGVPATRLHEVVTVQYAKVAEYQRRGLVHFHALIRLDGPRTPDGFAPAPRQVTATILARLVREAVTAVRFTAPPVHDHDVPRVLAFGGQVDARPVTTARRTDDPGAALSPEQVAGYLAARDAAPNNSSPTPTAAATPSTWPPWKPSCWLWTRTTPPPWSSDRGPTPTPAGTPPATPPSPKSPPQPPANTTRSGQPSGSKEPTRGSDMRRQPTLDEPTRPVASEVVRMERLWTIHDVAAYLGIPAGTLYQWRHRGMGPPGVRLGKHLRYQPAAVRAWVAEQVA